MSGIKAELHSSLQATRQLWARPEESSESIVSLYQRACAHADLTITELGLDAPGSVAHWGEDRPTRRPRRHP